MNKKAEYLGQIRPSAQEISFIKSLQQTYDIRSIITSIQPVRRLRLKEEGTILGFELSPVSGSGPQETCFFKS